MARTKNKKDNKASPILQNMMQKITKERGNVKTLINPEGEISMSDAISKIIAPYRDDAQNYAGMKKLVMVACAAWNASIMPAAKRESMLAEMSALMPDKQSHEDFMVIVKDLMKRKNKLYPNVNRMIVEFKVTDRGNDFHIAVASTLEDK